MTLDFVTIIVKLHLFKINKTSLI